LTPAIGFLVFLAVTLAFLGCTVTTGLRAKRRPHLAFVVLSIAALGTTIYYAEKLGQLYDLESAGFITPLHLAIAKLATLAYLLPIVTGARLWFGKGSRKLHFWIAMAVLALTVVTAVTGTWMVLASEPVDGAGSDGRA